MTLFLYRYNNYYNRIVKKENNISDYGEPLVALTGANFNPNDGITAEHIFNYYGDTPDYMIAANTDNTIHSRWYVVEAVRTRGGQYKLSLMRDVVADWYDEIVNAPCFIEKATLDVNNPLIFNNENMTYNQIKQSETLIKDRSGVAWYAIYCKPELEATINLPAYAIKADIEISNIRSWEYYDYQKERYFLGADPETAKLVVDVFEEKSVLGATYYNQFYFGTNISNLEPVNPNKGKHKLTWPEGVNKEQGAFDEEKGFEISTQMYAAGGVGAAMNRTWKKAIKNKLDSANLVNTLYAYTPYSNRTDPTYLNGKIIRDVSDNKYYQVAVIKMPSEWISTPIPPNSGLFTNVKDALLTGYDLPLIESTYQGDSSPMSYETKHPAYLFSIVEISNEESEFVIPETRRHCVDAPYDVLLIPDDGLYIQYRSADINKYVESSSVFAEAVIKSLLKTSADYIYDIQRVPYTTLSDDLFFPNWSSSDGKSMVTTQTLEEGLDYAQSNIEGSVYGLVFFPQTTSVNKTVKSSNFRVDLPTDSIELKVMNECDMYRIVSPNFNGQFEFSAAKNGGIKGFDISFTMIPYQPYIKVSPIFGGLYGQSFNDARGLICSGDFSITQTSDAWETYKYNNKNFQEMFDRQIQNMEINNSMQRKMDVFGAWTGTVSGATSGALAGGMMAGGHPAGFIAGAAIGGTASAVGGAADVAIGDKLRREAIDFTQDNFGYQLGNIQALPYNITKLSTVSSDNKIFPFLEYYTCTEEEKEALRSKIQYNGMTVGVIGTIANYIQSTESYIKGKLIRLENIADDYHTADIISREINLGVFI